MFSHDFRSKTPEVHETCRCYLKRANSENMDLMMKSVNVTVNVTGTSNISSEAPQALNDQFPVSGSPKEVGMRALQELALCCLKVDVCKLLQDKHGSGVDTCTT